jgi:serine/threonine-protein kinase/endoribonuclease IRE1
VEDLYGTRSNEGTNWIGEQIFVEKIKKSLGPKQILWQATKGLEYLHHLKYVHRNLKPSNFLIAKISDTDQPDEYKVKLSDFSYSKQPKESPIVSGPRGSNGWIAPISETGTIKALEDYVADDVFVIGSFFHYVLTNGLHPFGNNSQRINSNSDPVYCAAWNPSLEKQNEQANFLLKQMIKFDPNERCSLIQVLDSHYFLPDEDYYKLYDIPGEVKPGICVIFNQEIFDDVNNFSGYTIIKIDYNLIFFISAKKQSRRN